MHSLSLLEHIMLLLEVEVLGKMLVLAEQAIETLAQLLLLVIRLRQVAAAVDLLHIT
jgi:hypothetical protein